ncbi:MAG: PLP-dependent aminotransferase family protein [Ruminococcaceae bacterium]|nr:PLP-dependent aminotransferase family protein [Oscillospiraceae bacterium]
MTEYIFSDRIAGLKPSAVREILKSTSDPNVVSLAAGNPAPEAFPKEELKTIATKIFNEEPITALQYGITEGYAPLIELLKEYLKKRYNMGTENDELIITSGATQIMDLLTKVLCNEGDVVACENPSFIGSLNCFRSYNCKLLGIDIEEDGINVEQFEEKIKDCKVKFLYTIPNFQNPSGVTLSVEKRQKVYELAKKYDFLVLEDNPYGDLRVEGEDLPTIKSLDTEGRVIYAGTFSKLIAPGIRVGYVLAPKALISKMTVGKQTEDVHTPMFNQLLVYHFMKDYDIDEHINKMSQIYKKKRDLMLSLIDAHLGDKVTYVKPEGGMFVWCKLCNDIDMLTFCKEAVNRKVAVVPGTAFLTDENEKTNYIRLNFSTPTDDDMKKGIKILGDIANGR